MTYISKRGLWLQDGLLMAAKEGKVVVLLWLIAQVVIFFLKRVFMDFVLVKDESGLRHDILSKLLDLTHSDFLLELEVGRVPLVCVEQRLRLEEVNIDVSKCLEYHLILCLGVGQAANLVEEDQKGVRREIDVMLLIVI